MSLDLLKFLHACRLGESSSSTPFNDTKNDGEVVLIRTWNGLASNKCFTLKD